MNITFECNTHKQYLVRGFCNGANKRTDTVASCILEVLSMHIRTEVINPLDDDE